MLNHLSVLYADVLLDPSFEEVQRSFCQKHCHKFEVCLLSVDTEKV